MRLLLLTITVIAILTAGNARSLFAQTKFDSYGQLPTDDEAARLDLFAEELRNHPNLRGYLIGYNELSVPPGIFLRRLYGDQTYLTEARGLEPSRVTVIEGGYRNKLTIELWVAPHNAGAPLPTLTVPYQVDAMRRYRFDEECLECAPAVFLDLPGLGAGLKFYAAALRYNSGARALIVVRPGQYTSRRRALADARLAKLRLNRQHGIASGRIGIRLAQRRKDNVGTAELWIIPRNAK